MEKIHVYLAGDSTMSDYEPERYPRTGWGQVFQNHFKEDVIVCNHGASGRSTKTFMEEERLQQIDEKIRPNDYLFIQFGHNDSKVDSERYTDPFTTYKKNLRAFIEVARKKQAQPVLLTPVQRRNFEPDGSVIDSHKDYPVAMRELAQELDVPLIDITKSSTTMLAKLGDRSSKKLFMWLEPGEYDYYPDGEQDNTHFSLEGAERIAQLVVDGLKEFDFPLVKCLKESVHGGNV
ncbi:rhamnogalacturonan acetylesterase [Aquibacillus rhizosphaerae]|uniref:Rhamnogalacturonan acetylesterase n=1 Tax=Aquibacillus rhizosphaerae TaxID=3051431 RepID=A0ABT7L338_9BACI|nr:rhamnogalacturonan acetylesterase [Aquibacillus sp. LR5S19]MDL4840282.1 rhamnogalacturonan acetylesterase [Aquibacillus sp. LR5S19]